MKPTMSPSELLEVLPELISARLPVLLKGRPGVGKTDVCEQSAQAAKAEFLVSHPVVSEPTDYKGLPWVVNGEAVFLPVGELKRLLTAKKPLVYMLDDLGQAPEAVQAATMHLLLSRSINGHQISDQVTFIAATNAREDLAGVTGILEPVKSRFATIIELVPNKSDWCQWARSRKLPGEVVAFVESHEPDIFASWKATSDIVNSPCPRTVTNAAKVYKLDVAQATKRKLVAGAAGEAFSTEFFAFLERIDEWPDIDECLAAPEKFVVPGDPSMQYAIAIHLAGHMSQANANNMMALVRRLPVEYQMVAMKAATNRDANIMKTRAYALWASTNSEYRNL